MAVASSSPLEYIEAVTGHWGIQKYFKQLVSGESVKNPKPAPDVFMKNSRAYGDEVKGMSCSGGLPKWL